jgi:hypothetical protein
MASNGFGHEVAVLLQTAQNLGRLRQEQNRAEFEETLRSTGMDGVEALTYWDLVDVRGHPTGWTPINNGQVAKLKTNTELANGLGIELSNGENQPPRNWLLYRLFELQFPGMFAATYSGSAHLQLADVKKNVPQGQKVNSRHRCINFSRLPLSKSRDGRGAGDPLSVCRVLQGQEPAKFRAEVLRVALPLREALGEELGMQLADLLFDLQMLIPPHRMAQLLARVIREGQQGQIITLVGAFCPDYAYEHTNNPHVPYRYTFDGVGEGVGLVAKQFARIVPELSRLLRFLGILHHFVIGIGDFEADSESCLERVKLDRQEFIRRCQCSLNAFRQLMPPELPLTLELFGEERSNGRFRRYAQEATERMIAGDFGRMREVHDDLDEVLQRIPSQYRTFYERWHGVTMDDEAVRRIVFSQGGEYSGVARIYDEDFGSNVIMLAGDRPEMNRFNAFFAMQPVLCAKRAY